MCEQCKNEENIAYNQSFSICQLVKKYKQTSTVLVN